MAETSLAGRLLVATPLIGDGIFDRSVVALLAHSDEGAFGVVLNRPTATPAVELLDGWGPRAAAPAVVFDGGPVGPDRVIGMAGDGPVDLHADPADANGGPDELRLFVGSAGWSPGQLESELGERAWWVLDRLPGDTLTRHPQSLWEDVLRRQRGVLAWHANYPDDLRVG